MFTIETAKWSWAAPVKEKQVYRDEEFIRTKTKEEALLAIDFLMTKPQRMTYTITVFREGQYFTHFRHSMPCLGGLVKYRDSHGEKYFMNPYFPRDIRVAYPEGDTIFIAYYRQNSKNLPSSSPYFEFIFSQESPWVSAFGNKETIIFKDNYFVLTNMNTDPTVFYSLMRLGGLSGGGVYGAKSKHNNPKADILLTKTITSNHAGDPRRLAGQKPIRTSGGTWSEGYGYTRPYNESIFKASIPHKLKDFASTSSDSGYPQAPHTNQYFLEEMKKQFNLDVSTINVMNVTKEQEEILVKAWDYFKEKAKELSDD